MLLDDGPHGIAGASLLCLENRPCSRTDPLEVRFDSVGCVTNNDKDVRWFQGCDGPQYEIEHGYAKQWVHDLR